MTQPPLRSSCPPRAANSIRARSRARSFRCATSRHDGACALACIANMFPIRLKATSCIVNGRGSTSARTRHASSIPRRPGAGLCALRRLLASPAAAKPHRTSHIGARLTTATAPIKTAPASPAIVHIRLEAEIRRNPPWRTARLRGSLRAAAKAYDGARNVPQYVDHDRRLSVATTRAKTAIS